MRFLYLMEGPHPFGVQTMYQMHFLLRNKICLFFYVQVFASIFVILQVVGLMLCWCGGTSRGPTKGGHMLPTLGCNAMILWYYGTQILWHKLGTWALGGTRGHRALGGTGGCLRAGTCCLHLPLTLGALRDFDTMAVTMAITMALSYYWYYMLSNLYCTLSWTLWPKWMGVVYMQYVLVAILARWSTKLKSMVSYLTGQICINIYMIFHLIFHIHI